MKWKTIHSLYNKFIEEASSEYGIDSEVIAGVIMQESAGNFGAISKAGARGLMQLMPETARDLGVFDTFNARENIMGGTRYLKQNARS